MKKTLVKTRFAKARPLVRLPVLQGDGRRILTWGSMNIRLAKAKAFGLSTIILYSNFIKFFAVTLPLQSIDLESTPGVNADDAIYGAWLIAWH